MRQVWRSHRSSVPTCLPSFKHPAYSPAHFYQQESLLTIDFAVFLQQDFYTVELACRLLSHNLSNVILVAEKKLYVVNSPNNGPTHDNYTFTQQGLMLKGNALVIGIFCFTQACSVVHITTKASNVEG